MRIGIYLDPVSLDAPPGGAAFCAAVLAEHLERDHDVDLLHHRGYDRDLLNRVFGLRMQRTRLRYCEPVAHMAPTDTRVPWRRYRAARQWRAELSAQYDAFVAFVHGAPPFCHTDAGVLVILFPMGEPPWIPAARGLKTALLRAYDAWEWRRRFASYRHRVAISKFASEWTRQRWNVECGVRHPPVDRVATGPKEDLILSVSRFAPVKKQPELVAAFRDLAPALPRSWSFACAGGLDASAESRAYFARAEAAAAGAPVRFHCNLARTELDVLYGRARIFWHAMGYGEDISRFPERMEHFGIATVEAMSAGCVPLVFDGGGQAEIVRHGLDGFRWKTLYELQQYTRRLASDDTLRGVMSRSAMERAAQFGRSSYLDAITQMIAG